MDFFATFFFPALAGLVVGVFSGLLGIGGGTMMVPVFSLFFHMSPIASTATSLFTIIPTSVSGAISHLRHKTCVPMLGVAAGLGGALTSPIGVWLAQISPAWLVIVAAALIICYSAFDMLSKAAKMKKPSASRAQVAAVSGAGDGASVGGAQSSDILDDHGSAAGEGAGVDADPGLIGKPTRKQLAIGALIGLGAGLASGYVGVGGGFIMVPLLISLVGISMRQASGTSLIAVMILAIPGVIEQGILGNIHYLAGISLAIGSIPGAFLGARFVHKVPERTLRFTFGGFLIVAACMLVVDELVKFS